MPTKIKILKAWFLLYSTLTFNFNLLENEVTLWNISNQWNEREKYMHKRKYIKVSMNLQLIKKLICTTLSVTTTSTFTTISKYYSSTMTRLVAILRPRDLLLAGKIKNFYLLLLTDLCNWFNIMGA